MLADYCSEWIEEESMGTNLTVNSQGMADVQVQTVQLRSLLGSYELFVFNFGHYLSNAAGRNIAMARRAWGACCSKG